MDYVLNAGHLQEVRKFVTFFEAKRKESINEIQTAFAQCLKSNAKDEILSWSEVENIIKDLKDEVRITVDSELQNIVYMSGVYVKILMSQAESHSLHLQGDISFIENEKAIEEMRNIGNVEKELTKKTTGARLPTLNAGLVNEQNAMGKVKELTEERDLLKRKNLDQQTRIMELIEEINKLRNESGHVLIKSESIHENEVKEVSQALEETKVDSI